MTPDDLSLLERTVQGIAGSFCRRVYWADKEELLQAGRVEGLVAMGTYDPKEGPLGGYLARVVVRAIHSAVLRESSPVTASATRLKLLKGHTRTVVEAAPAETSESPEDAFLREEAAVIVRRALARAAQHQKGLVGAHVIARRALGEPSASANVIEETGLPREVVYKSIAAVVTRLKADEELRSLWER